MAGKYNYLWNQLKDKKYLQTKFPRTEHNRILRLLRRESAVDLGYRFSCLDRGEAFVIRFHQVGDVLFLNLEFSDKIPKNFIRDPRGKVNV